MKRRLVDGEIIFNDDFIELSDKAKILYFGLLSNTDDDGFCDKVAMLLLALKCEDKHLQELENRFIIRFKDSKVICVKDFRRIQDLNHYTETKYKHLKQRLYIDDEATITTDPTPYPCSMFKGGSTVNRLEKLREERKQNASKTLAENTDILGFELTAEDLKAKEKLLKQADTIEGLES